MQCNVLLVFQSHKHAKWNNIRWIFIKMLPYDPIIIANQLKTIIWGIQCLLQTLDTDISLGLESGFYGKKPC
jgi:hypothetical protein